MGSQNIRIHYVKRSVIVKLQFWRDLFTESLPGIFEAAGIGAVKHYRYWDSRSRKVCVDEMIEDLEKAPEQSVVVLSASGHRPTGADLSQDEWKCVTEILEV